MSLFFPSILNEKRWTLLAILSAFVLAVYISTGSNVARISNNSSEFVTSADYSSSFQKALKEQLERQNSNLLASKLGNGQPQFSRSPQAQAAQLVADNPQTANPSTGQAPVGSSLLLNAAAAPQQAPADPAAQQPAQAPLQAQPVLAAAPPAAPYNDQPVQNLYQQQVQLNQNSQISSNNLGYWA